MNKKVLIVLGIIIVAAIAGYFLLKKPASDGSSSSQKPRPQVNIIPQKDRPYVTLDPLTSRNSLEFVVHDLKKPAKSVELTLEYDRNKGVLDAVLHEFDLDEMPFTTSVFLGSKSAGGHVTYHEDVIGGTMRLDFMDQDYSLEVPWRYDDTGKSYDQLSTTDAKFQLVLEDPIRKSKVIVMESPGLPAQVDGTVLAGPYYVSTVGDLPDTTADVTIRLTETVESATIMGWDGESWQEFDSVLDGKTITATATLVSTYIVIN